MFNQLKSEALKLRYSRLFLAIPLLCLAGLFLYASFSLSKEGTQIFVSEGDEETDSAIQGVIGFFAFSYQSADAPKFHEILQSCLSCNVFLWVIALIFTIQFFCADYAAGTIRLPVAYGISRVKVFLAKLIVIVLYNGACYFFFYGLTLCFTCMRAGYIPDGAQILQCFYYVGLNFLVMASFLVLCLMACICLKHTGVAATALCIFTLGGAIVYTGIWQNFHSHAALKYLVWLNPLYYWMNMGSFRFAYGLIYEIIAYFAFSFLVLLPICVLLIRKQELK